MSLQEVWQAASGSPFAPVISKDSHFLVGFTLLLIGLSLTALFGLNRSLTSLPVLGIPASLAFGFGAVYMICAVGVNPISFVSGMDSNPTPMFTAVSGSTRQLFLLLRCIGFSPKAEVQITAEGLRFSVEESRAVQGLTFLEKALFSSYTFVPSSITESSRDEPSSPGFQVNLSALLETLQIFGLSDTTSSSSSRNPNGGFTSSFAQNGFNAPALATTGGTCRISYPDLGAPLSITITEAGVTTTCDLNTYEPANGVGFDVDESIPLQRDALTLKVIMRSTWLYHAITEIASTNPTVLILNASKRELPLFALEGAGGPFGDSMVDFQPEESRFRASSNSDTISFPNANPTEGPEICETFTVLPSSGGSRVRQRYQFEHIEKASRAMGLASKVCIRCDRQGVLSLQFMIELAADGIGVGTALSTARNGRGGGSTASLGGAGAGRVSFVDFRFVPLLDDQQGELGEEEEEEGAGEEVASSRYLS